MLGGKRRKEQPHAQSFKGTCGNSYGKGGREAHVGLPLSAPDVQAMVLRMPMKGSRAHCARLSVFLMAKECVNSVARSFPLCTPRLPEALQGLCHTSQTQPGLLPLDLEVDGTGSPCTDPCLSAPIKQGLPNLPPLTRAPDWPGSGWEFHLHK